MIKIQKFLTWFIIIGGLFLLNLSQVNAFNANDAITKYVSFTNARTEIFEIPVGYDLFVKNVQIYHYSQVPPLNTDAELIVSDDTNIVWRNFVQEGRTNDVFNHIFRNSLEIENLLPHDIDITISGFLFLEGSEINYNGDVKTDDYYQEWFIKFFASDKSGVVMGSMIIWFMCLMLINLTIKWGFKAGILFYKNKFIGKRNS